MVSQEEKREYRIFVSVPASPPPEGGYPVLYTLDPNSVFGTLTEAVRVQGNRPEKSGVIPMLIVGIGYNAEVPFAPGRYYDYTLPADVSELPARPDGSPWPKHGGADAFLRFIEQELKPVIEREYPVDRSKTALFGHSLGGLFVLHTLFTKPSAFRTYIAGSPSIHWSRRLFDEEERDFVRRCNAQGVEASLFIGVGGLEGSHKSRMVDNARELAERLAPLEGKGLKLRFHEFPDEGHVSVLPPLVSRAVRFASNGEIR
ncbi:alpha/beta hydrolase [Paenibacillus ginsengarvi]|uniref:Alpha/beta hydrolase n=2 Tax=Paenibacillus ginsengarvi TaxID=400777 RepID=A0A3B0CIH5_9BACL|nr:alpha/beta hydrolase [Paenibacillus ginsengarvi]